MLGLSVGVQWIDVPDQQEDKPLLDGVVFNQVTEEDNIFLCRKFAEAELREAVWACEGTKAQDPMG